MFLQVKSCCDSLYHPNRDRESGWKMMCHNLTSILISHRVWIMDAIAIKRSPAMRSALEVIIVRISGLFLALARY